jgi:hypothetical protein
VVRPSTNNHNFGDVVAQTSNQYVTIDSDLQETDLHRRMTHVRVALVLVRIICRFFHMVAGFECISSSMSSNQELRNHASHLFSWLDGVSCSLQEGAYTSGSSSQQSVQDFNVSPENENTGPKTIQDSTPIRILLHSHIAMIHR